MCIRSQDHGTWDTMGVDLNQIALPGIILFGLIFSTERRKPFLQPFSKKHASTPLPQKAFLYPCFLAADGDTR
jgi:hypothetical protein